MSGFTVGELLAARRRSEPGGLALLPLLLMVSAGLGGWIGLDLHLPSAAATADGLFFILLAVSAPLPVAAVGALYHDPLHVPLLPWPVSAAKHFSLGLRLMFGQHLPWAAFSAGLGAGAAWGTPPLEVAAFSIFGLVFYVGAALVAVGFAGFCAATGDSDAPIVGAFRRSVAGPFASERHAPFFYFPAAAFALTAIAASVAQAGLVAVVSDPSSARALALYGAPLWVGVALLLGGALAYRVAALRTVARVIEEAKTIYGGRPAPADPPYGAWVSGLLPRMTAAYYAKELREQARAQRALWPAIVLVLVMVGAYAANVGMPMRAAPVVAVVLVVWVSSSPTRRTPRQAGVKMMLTLPEHRLAALGGRWLALAFVAAHLLVAVCLTLAYRHDGTIAGWMMVLALAAMTLSVAATRPRRDAPGWPLLARLTPAAVLIVGLVGLASFAYGLALAAALGLVAFFEIARK